MTDLNPIQVDEATGTNCVALVDLENIKLSWQRTYCRLFEYRDLLLLLSLFERISALRTSKVVIFGTDPREYKRHVVRMLAVREGLWPTAMGAGLQQQQYGPDDTELDRLIDQLENTRGIPVAADITANDHLIHWLQDDVLLRRSKNAEHSKNQQNAGKNMGPSTGGGGAASAVELMAAPAAERNKVLVLSSDDEEEGEATTNQEEEEESAGISSQRKKRKAVSAKIERVIKRTREKLTKIDEALGLEALSSEASSLSSSVESVVTSSEDDSDIEIVNDVYMENWSSSSRYDGVDKYRGGYRGRTMVGSCSSSCSRDVWGGQGLEKRATTTTPKICITSLSEPRGGTTSSIFGSPPRSRIGDTCEVEVRLYGYKSQKGRTVQKGCDVALGSELTKLCFHPNVDTIVLFSADSDFQDLVESCLLPEDYGGVIKYAKICWVCGFRSAFSHNSLSKLRRGRIAGGNGSGGSLQGPPLKLNILTRPIEIGNIRYLVLDEVFPQIKKMIDSGKTKRTHWRPWFAHKGGGGGEGGGGGNRSEYGGGGRIYFAGNARRSNVRSKSRSLTRQSTDIITGPPNKRSRLDEDKQKTEMYLVSPLLPPPPPPPFEEECSFPASHHFGEERSPSASRQFEEDPLNSAIGFGTAAAAAHSESLSRSPPPNNGRRTTANVPPPPPPYALPASISDAPALQQAPFVSSVGPMPMPVVPK